MYTYCVTSQLPIFTFLRAIVSSTAAMFSRLPRCTPKCLITRYLLKINLYHHNDPFLAVPWYPPAISSTSWRYRPDCLEVRCSRRKSSPFQGPTCALVQKFVLTDHRYFINSQITEFLAVFCANCSSAVSVVLVLKSIWRLTTQHAQMIYYHIECKPSYCITGFAIAPSETIYILSTLFRSLQSNSTVQQKKI